MRLDLKLIPKWVHNQSRVLDLGCGDGTLLNELKNQKHIDGLGVEIDEQRISECIRSGLNVVEQDLNEGLGNFQTDSFDTVIMAHALQTLRNPHLVLEEMLRVGKECIVTFPNFGHWRCRFHLGVRGHMPVSRFLPYHWYDTPNIHFCTVSDFETLCQEKGIRIQHRAVVGTADKRSHLANLWPNLFAVSAVYHISK